MAKQAEWCQKINAEILAQGVPSLDLAAAVRVRADGQRQVVHYIPEYGDNCGVDEIDGFVAEAASLLLPGEKLYRTIIKIPIKAVFHRGWINPFPAD